MAKFIGKDNNTANASITYWFELDQDVYGVVEGHNAGIVDNEGYPVIDDTKYYNLPGLLEVEEWMRK